MIKTFFKDAWYQIILIIKICEHSFIFFLCYSEILIKGSIAYSFLLRTILIILILRILGLFREIFFFYFFEAWNLPIRKIIIRKIRLIDSHIRENFLPQIFFKLRF